METRIKLEETPSNTGTDCNSEDQGQWSPCEPRDGGCGPGIQTWVKKVHYGEGTASDDDNV